MSVTIPHINTLIPVALPAGLSWNTGSWPIFVNLKAPNMLERPFGVLSAGSFDPLTASAYTTAIAGTTVYVASTGNDTTGDGTVGNPYLSIQKAVSILNAGGSPGRIRVAAGLYHKDTNFTKGNAANVATVDIVYEATGGRAVVTTHDNTLTWTLDGTYTNCYGSSSLANAPARVLNFADRDAYGLHPDFIKAPDAATCNATPGSWYYDSGGTKLYINRGDGLVVTSTGSTANSRVYRSVPNFFINGATQRNFWLKGQNPGDGFDLEGAANTGATASCMNVTFSGSSSGKILYAKDCSFRYAGYYNGSQAGNGVGINNFSGIGWFENCDASGNGADGFNCHDTNVYGANFLTLNCTGYRNGVIGSTSNNGWTTHEAVIGIDIGGDYEANAGCTCHSINTAKSFMVGTRAAKSRGDIIFGGTFRRAEFRVSNTAAMYCFNTRAIPANAATHAYQASDTASIFTRSTWPNTGSNNADSGATITTY